LLKLVPPELGRDLVDATLMEQQNSCYDRFGHTLGGGPPHRLTMKFDSESIGHGRDSEPLVASSLGSQAGLASALDMDVIRPCHRNDRILRLNPIPKAQENLIRFRAETPSRLRRLARPAHTSRPCLQEGAIFLWSVLRHPQTGRELFINTATTRAIVDPARIRVAAPLLGQRTFTTTEPHEALFSKAKRP
jgi:hypothetical protein